MNVVSGTRAAPEGAHIGESIEALAQIGREDLSLAVFRRALPAGLSASLLEWAARARPALDQAETSSLAGALGGLDEAARRFLVSDVELLTAHFGALAGGGRIALRFGLVESDSCRKFHADHMRLRLITTYAGPGTLWLPSYAVDRAALASPSGDAEADNARIVRNAEAVRRARAGDVLLMKGALYGGAHTSLVHRSPPASFGARVVLVLNAV